MHKHAIATSCRTPARLMHEHAVAASLCPFEYVDPEASWLRPPGCGTRGRSRRRSDVGTCSPRRQRGHAAYQWPPQSLDGGCNRQQLRT
eukprot:14302702-Heterocapsa_arctica.AAC.1